MRSVIATIAIGLTLLAGVAFGQNFQGDGTPTVKESEKIYAHPPQLAPPGVAISRPNSNEEKQGAQPGGPDRGHGVGTSHPDVQG
jgi:hypothetical protein